MAPKLILSTDPVPARAIILDTETTGFTPKGGHRIVELAAHEMIAGKLTGLSFHRYLNPGRTVPPEAHSVHGLTNTFLKGKPRFRDIAPEFLDFLGDANTPIIAHNASFDQRFIEAEMGWAKAVFRHSFLCSMKLARALPLPTENVKLETLAAHIGYRWEGRGAHSALEDTKALATVLTDLLWPLEAETARNAPAKAARTSAPAKPAAPAPKAAAVALPDGFVPLTAAADARICRYDELSTEGVLFGRGKRWDQGEVNRLIARFIADKAPIETLVAEHGRTPAAIFLKLEGLGVIAPDHPYARH